MPKFDINGLSLHYQLKGEGEPLLLLHGLGSSSNEWAAQVEFFANRYQTITVDLRGHGQSDKPAGPYSMPMFAADVIALLDHLNIHSVHIVGLSMGGMIAFELALMIPDRTCSMTIVNSGPAVVPRTLKEHWSLLRRRLLVKFANMRKIGEVLAPRMLPQSEREADRQYVIEQWAKNDKAAYTHSFNAIVGWSVAERISEISCPSLIVASDNDYTPVAVKEAYMADMPNAELAVIKDAHHAVNFEHPEAFNQVLDAFLNKCG